MPDGAAVVAIEVVAVAGLSFVSRGPRKGTVHGNVPAKALVLRALSLEPGEAVRVPREISSSAVRAAREAYGRGTVASRRGVDGHIYLTRRVQLGA